MVTVAPQEPQDGTDSGPPRGPAFKEPESHLFTEINELRRPERANPEADQEAADKAKLNGTIFGKIAGSKRFEYSTLSVIVFNAGFIGYDADFSARFPKPESLYNCGDLEPDSCYQFMIVENFFAIYFTFEVIVRFFAYKRKLDSVWDAWFVFDSVLVIFMVAETWVLPVIGASGGLKKLSVLRLLRLLRITRMAKLMRFFPELQIIVKGMLAAVRSVLCTGILLILILYVFSILFTSEYHQGDKPDADVTGTAQELFGSMGKSMRHLFIMGTILDDITLCCNSIRGSNKGPAMLTAFIVFVLISSFTMLNMLIGILCEVVCATGEGERKKNTESKVRDAITELFTRMDKDQNGEITREEFLSMKHDKLVMSALGELEVKAKHFEMYAELMFKPEDASGVPDKTKTFNYDTILNMILRLRPGTKVSALDFASFQMSIYKKHDGLRRHLNNIEQMAVVLADENPDAILPTPKLDKTQELKAISQAAANPLPELDKLSEQDLLTELAKRLGSFKGISNGSMAGGQETRPPDIAWSNELYTC